jgi:PAS domain S-box-containing protein
LADTADHASDEIELSLRASSAELMEALPDGIVIVDADGRIAFVNARLQQLSGYERDELLEGPLEVLVPEELRPSHRRHREDYGAAPHVRSMGSGLDIHLRRADGAEIPVDIQLSPLEIAGRRLTVAAVREISDRTITGAGLKGKAADWDRFRQLLHELDALIETLSLPASRQDPAS